MIDLHTHILPGVDDGVKSEDEAVAFAKIARADGIRTLVATPHAKDGFFDNHRRSVLEAVERLGRRLAKESVAIEIVPGAEVFLAPDLVERVHDGRAPTLADNGRTLLLELSATQYPIDLSNLVFRLKLAGILTVFAHPERIRYFQEDLRRYEELVRLGAYGQITAGSVLGLFGEDAQQASDALLRGRLVHVLASDSHNVRARAPVLSRALGAVASIVGEAAALRMVTDSPRALLEGREIEADTAADTSRPRSWWSRLFRRG